MTIQQLWQRNIRSAGYGPALRWSVKCFICAPQSLQTRVGTSSALVAESGIAYGWQKSRIAAEQFRTLSKILGTEGTDFAPQFNNPEQMPVRTLALHGSPSRPRHPAFGITGAAKPRLLKRMLACGVSKYHPDPLAAIQNAQKLRRGIQHRWRGGSVVLSN